VNVKPIFAEIGIHFSFGVEWSTGFNGQLINVSNFVLQL